MSVLENLTTWNTRNGRARHTSEVYGPARTGRADLLDRNGARYKRDGTRIADARPLREVAAQQGAMLRQALSTTPTGRKTPTAQRIADKVAAVRTAQAAPAPQARPAVASVNRQDSFKLVNDLANTVPVGVYALRRAKQSISGNDITFLKVWKDRNGQHRIVQLIGGVGAFSQQPLKLEHQYFALKHIGEDVGGAAALYGQEARECGFCRGMGRTSPLTHKRSRAAGYGRACADKNGLPW